MQLSCSASTPFFLTCGYYQVLFLADFALVIWSLNPHISSLLTIIQMCSRARALTGLVYLMDSLGDVDQLHQLRNYPFSTKLGLVFLDFFICLCMVPVCITPSQDMPLYFDYIFKYLQINAPCKRRFRKGIRRIKM